MVNFSRIILVLGFMMSMGSSAQIVGCKLGSDHTMCMYKAELTERLDRLLAKTEADNETWIARFYHLQAENAELRAQNSKQDEEIALLKKQQISNLESSLDPSNLDSHYSNEMKDGGSVVDGPSLRALIRPPSTCKEVADNNGLVPLNGNYLLKNNNKLQAVYCQFIAGNPVTVSQQLIGNVDVKTKTVHFYVQRNTKFSRENAIVPFEFAHLNEGGAMDLTSGTFTAPVPGIYHFGFSAMNEFYTFSLGIILQLNGTTVGTAFTYASYIDFFDTVSLTASLRLKAKDRVNLYRQKSGVPTHFTGWLVEEDLI